MLQPALRGPGLRCLITDIGDGAFGPLIFMAKPQKGKAKVKVTASGKKVSYGQAGEAKGGGPRVKPGTSKGDSYCARSLGIKKRLPKEKTERPQYA